MTVDVNRFSGHSDAPQPPARQPRRHWARRALLLVGVLLLSLAVLGGAASVAMRWPQAWLGAAAAVAHVKPWLVLAHMVLIGALWWRWGQFIDWLYRCGRIQARSVKPCLAMRTRFAVWLLVLEFLTVIRPWEWFVD